MWRTAFRLTASLLLTMFIVAPGLAAVCQANCVRAAAPHSAARPASDEHEDCHHAARTDVLRLTSGEPCGNLMVVAAPVTLVTPVRLTGPGEGRLAPATSASDAAGRYGLPLVTVASGPPPLDQRRPLSPAHRFSVLRI